ncbi:hypothetical protein S245_011920, partial [Arachis hypogaea]
QKIVALQRNHVEVASHVSTTGSCMDGLEGLMREIRSMFSDALKVKQVAPMICDEGSLYPRHQQQFYQPRAAEIKMKRDKGLCHYCEEKR